MTRKRREGAAAPEKKKEKGCAKLEIFPYGEMR